MSPIFSLQRLYVQLVQLLIILRANIGIQKKKNSPQLIIIIIIIITMRRRLQKLDFMLDISN